jgi:hypothetical protein
VLVYGSDGHIKLFYSSACFEVCGLYMLYGYKFGNMKLLYVKINKILYLIICHTSLQRGVGGPVMDFDGNVIGMNFYDKKGTPFLPSFIVLKCLQHFKDFKYAL